jgi:hypothetical protein
MIDNKPRIKGYDKFNNLQNKILISAIGFLILLVLFPPWTSTAPNGMTGSIGHHIIFFPPSGWRYPALDFGRLIVEIFGVILISGAAIFGVRD